MKPNGYLHIGLQKTGTTSLQQFLFDNNLKLNKLGFHYPSSLGQVNHIYLAACGQSPNKLDDIRISMGIRGPDDVARFRVKIATEIAAEIARFSGPPPAIVMSNEHIHGRIAKREEIDYLVKFIENFCDLKKIIVYLRRQDTLAVSLYPTIYRAGETRIVPVLPPTDPLPAFYDYGKMLEDYLSVVGRDRLEVRVFQRDHLRDGDLFSDFLAILGLDCDGGYVRPGNLNSALQPEAIRFFASINKYIPRFVDGRTNPDFMAVLNAIDSLFPGKAALVSRAKARAFYAAFATGNEWIRATFFPHQATLFGETFDDYAEGDPGPFDSYEDGVRVAAEIIRFLIRRGKR